MPIRDRMRRALRVVVYAMAAVIVGGTVASAVPGVRRSPVDQPSPSFAPSPAPIAPATPEASPTAKLSPEPAVTSEPTTVESPAPPDEQASDPEGSGPEGSQSEEGASGSGASHGGPDFSACDGLTGLQNAICRHEVLLQLDPNNPGLQNALAHLRENLGRHQANGSGKGAHGNPTGDDTGGGTA
jgi:hypothetical protein